MPRKSSRRRANRSAVAHIDPASVPDFLRVSRDDLRLMSQGKVEQIKEYFRRSSFGKAVIGLSGGIDSAVSAALAVRALGPENVIVLMLPCGQAHESVAVATEVADDLGIPKANRHLINIAFAVDASYKLAAAKLGERGDIQLQRGNMAARERMKQLMHAATVCEALLLGTENRTEEELAYYTIGGDQVSSLEPIHDLYKCQVYQLGLALKLPQSVLLRAPTAELWGGQTDEGELGVSYAAIDTVLAGLAIRGLSAKELADQYDVPAEVTARVMNRCQAVTGKRQAPHHLPAWRESAVQKIA